LSAPGIRLRINRGGLHMSRDVYEGRLAGIAGIILLRRQNDLLILPVRHAAAGGYLLKLRNSAGDRVAHAPDFFRAHGIGDEDEREITVAWDEDQGGFVGRGVLSEN
jgi:hypothetical protein